MRSVPRPSPSRGVSKTHHPRHLSLLLHGIGFEDPSVSHRLRVHRGGPRAVYVLVVFPPCMGGPPFDPADRTRRPSRLQGERDPIERDPEKETGVRREGAGRGVSSRSSSVLGDRGTEEFPWPGRREPVRTKRKKEGRNPRV
eukprot:scaffold416_cov329-Pavlova_lutheri.AAC.7